MPRENPLIFYPRRVWEIIRTYGPVPLLVWKLLRIRKRVLNDPEMKNYTDVALTPVDVAEDVELELFNHTEAARTVVFKEKAKIANNEQKRRRAA